MSTDSESTDYDIKPINSQCSTYVKTDIVPSHSGTTTIANNNIDSVQNQMTTSSQYDSDNITSPAPMYGGNNNYKIIFRKKSSFINSNTEKDAIKIFLNNKIYKRDYLLEISQNNKKSIYIIRANYKNKIKKIY
jgi:hypothetical protein